MPDSADIAAGIVEDTITNAVRQARNQILVGTAGECEQCEWWMPRLVDGLCGFCRDGRRRPPDWEPPPRPDAVATQPPEEKPAMPAKTVTLPASEEAAITAIEQHAARNDVSFGIAAARLIERGIAVPSASEAEPMALPSMRARLFAAIDVVAGLAAEILNQPSADAALARADAAEARAASLATELDVQTERANAADEKLAAAKALFA